MSYILDALRRADSDRERGSVPTLNSDARRGSPPDDEDDAPTSAVRPLWWAVAVLSALIVAMLGWLIWTRTTSPAPNAPDVGASVALDTPAASNPPSLVSPAVNEAPSAPNASSLSVPPVVPTPPLAPAVVTPPAARVAAAPPVNKPVPPKAPPAVTVPPQSTRPAAEPAESRNAERRAPEPDLSAVPSVADLPDDVRRQLPRLQVSGASYSKNPASRMLILNDQVFREGDQVTPDLVLEQIRLKSAVLKFRGQRYSISY